jgi:hypothetical protein
MLIKLTTPRKGTAIYVRAKSVTAIVGTQAISRKAEEGAS